MMLQVQKGGSILGILLHCLIVPAYKCCHQLWAPNTVEGSTCYYSSSYSNKKYRYI